jgi:hypothetical protein
VETGGAGPPNVRALLDTWFTFHILGGHFLVPLLVVTFLFSKAKRDATLINFGFTLILSSIANCLLSVIPLCLTTSAIYAPVSRLYTHEYLGPEPNKRLCIFQAAAFGASAPMFVLSLFRLIHRPLLTLSSQGGQLPP